MPVRAVSRAMRGCFAGLLWLAACGTGGPTPEAPAEPSSLHPPAPTPAPVAAPADAFALSVASYNINFGNGHSPQTVETIASLGTDIVLLQETTPSSEEAVRARLADEYPEIRFHHCCRAGGLAVLSKWPILDAEIIEPEIGFFPAWWLRVQTPRGPLVVVDVHLRPPISDGGSWVVGFFSTRAVRAREMAALWLDLPKDDPLLIAGDFNEEADGDVVALLSGEGLTTALPQFAGKDPTWHWKVGATTLRMQLDHVTYGAPLRATDARVVRGGLSDHEPVVVDLVWE